MSEREDIILADIMCKRYGKKKGLETPEKYWSLPVWKVFFKEQVLAANRLLKIYPFEVILSTVNNERVKWCFTLYYHGLKQILVEEMHKYEVRLKKEKVAVEKFIKREEVKEITSAPEILSERETLRNRLD